MKSNIIKKIAATTMIVAAMAAMTACGSSKSNSSNNTDAQNNTSISDTAAVTVNETQYPVTITTYDATGNQITQTFESAPERIVTNNLSATETLIELGLADKIVGMMTPDNEVNSEYKTEVEKIEKLGDKKTISKEIVLAAIPDIIIGRAAMFSDNSLGAYTTWNNNGVNIYAQSASVSATQVDLESVIEDVRNLGIIFNVQDKAEAYAKKLEAKLEKIKSQVSKTETNKNALVMCAYDGATFGAYKSTLQEKMLNVLGYTNIATGTSGLTLENMVTMNPEIIIYVTSDRNAKNDAAAVENLYNQEVIADVTAIKNKKIITIGYDEFMDYGPAVFDALETVAASMNK